MASKHKAPVTLEIKDGVGIIIVSNPPVNALAIPGKRLSPSPSLSLPPLPTTHAILSTTPRNSAARVA